MTLMSRGLGFVRDLLVADVLGAGPLADAFFVAFKLPNFLRRLFAEGAFNAGFVPMFARTLEADGPKVAKAFAEQAQAALVAVLVPLVLVAIPAMPWLITIFTPGLRAARSRAMRAAVELSRITFCYILFISLVALQSGVLNSMNLFGAAAASPVVLNLTMIAALGLSMAWLDAPAYTLAWSVAAAGLLQFLWLRLSLWRAGMALGVPLAADQPRDPAAVRADRAGRDRRQRRPDQRPDRHLLRLAAADRRGLLPVLCRSPQPAAARRDRGRGRHRAAAAARPPAARGRHPAALKSQNLAIELALLLTLPAALALIVLAWPIIHVLFEHGAFGPEDALKTSWALAAYAAGLPAYVLIKVLAPGFFAREDTKTPVKVALVCLAANLVLVVTLMWPLAHVGIALATALSAWLNAGLLAWLLRRDGLLQPDARLGGACRASSAPRSPWRPACGLRRAGSHPCRRCSAWRSWSRPAAAASWLLARLSGALDLGELRSALARRGRHDSRRRLDRREMTATALIIQPLTARPGLHISLPRRPGERVDAEFATCPPAT